MKKNRQEGDFIQIKLRDNEYCYGRVLESPLMAFYDLKSRQKLNLSDIADTPILFKIWVADSVFKDKRWKVIGNAPLPKDLKADVKFFKQDTISKELTILAGDLEVRASAKQCDGLERAAVWLPNHVEDRLRDHFLGVKNTWLESMKIN